MRAELSPDRWYKPTVELLGLAAAGLAIRLVGGNSPIVSGGMVFLAACLLLALVTLWNRALRPEPRHTVAYALVPILLVAVILAIDIQYIAENGMVVNSVAVAALIVGGLLRSRP